MVCVSQHDRFTQNWLDPITVCESIDSSTQCSPSSANYTHSLHCLSINNILIDCIDCIHVMWWLNHSEGKEYVRLNEKRTMKTPRVCCRRKAAKEWKRKGGDSKTDRQCDSVVEWLTTALMHIYQPISNMTIFQWNTLICPNTLLIQDDHSQGCHRPTPYYICRRYCRCGCCQEAARIV